MSWAGSAAFAQTRASSAGRHAHDRIQQRNADKRGDERIRDDVEPDGADERGARVGGERSTSTNTPSGASQITPPHQDHHRLAQRRERTATSVVRDASELRAMASASNNTNRMNGTMSPCGRRTDRVGRQQANRPTCRTTAPARRS